MFVLAGPYLTDLLEVRGCSMRSGSGWECGEVRDLTLQDCVCTLV